MTFSGTADPSATGASVGRAYNVGMTVGNVCFRVHPGFILTTAPIDYEVVLSGVGANYTVDVSIEQAGVGAFSDSYVLSQSIFGAGGAVSSFGGVPCWVWDWVLGH